MLVICINSFNTPFYTAKATALAAAVAERSPSATVFVAYGGCARDAIARVGRTLHVAVTCNLSDHNVYAAFALAERRGALGAAVAAVDDARFVMLHDTVLLGPAFAERMEAIERQPPRHEWTFAHTYGLYNMGVATCAFMRRRAADWAGITRMEKGVGVRLEQGQDVTIAGRRVPSLHSYSTHTLAEMAVPTDRPDGACMQQLDHITLNAYVCGDDRRFVSYIAAFGVFKPFASKLSFFTPIMAHPSHAPATEDELRALRGRSWNAQMNRDVWIPLLRSA